MALQLKETSNTTVAMREMDEAKIRRLATVVQDSNDAIMISDFEGRITAWNRGAELMYGYTEKDALQMTLWQITPSNRAAEKKEFIRRLKEGETITSFETQRETKDGRILDVWMTVTKMLDDAGKPVGIASTERDITERKPSEEKIIRLNNELLRKNAELEQLIYVASHDLRTPLVNVQGFSKEMGLLVDELAEIASHAGLPEKQQSRLTDIVSKEFPEAQNYVLASVIKMDALLKGLLKLSRLGRTAITLQKIDMDEMLSAVLKTLEFQIQKSKARVDVAALPACIGDPDQVNQVFTNIIDNAVKYLDPNRPGVIRITGKSQNGFSEYCVEDNGIGIAQERQAKAFEIFLRLEPERCEGEGLGLAIVKKIVYRLGGNIRLESEEGRGSKFIVSLPAG